MICRFEDRLEQRLQGRDATSSDTNAYFDGSPDSKVSRAVEKVALVWLEGRGVGEANDCSCRAAGADISPVSDCGRVSDLHCCQTNNGTDDDLHAALHLQVLYDEDG